MSHTVAPSYLPVWHGCRDHATNHCDDCASCDCFEADMPYECPDCGEGHTGDITGTEYCPSCDVDRENAKRDADDEVAQ